ncbi:methionyl-tRNA formyltransferase [Candidatus Mycoplasma mahonii]|uniref:methionyl-tRNA formyltransferase n=1 Tax=Candidatus Mycoplasma mahonii TaxID=3004105 RepID=UPI0026EEF688|nr:methionyl-tRNA formyltransferase [Candidatus Mycoplasma mahonii]WKX02316.1 methionyl-tRNA formyltransferase [Candidatus Mycoplasma mahonii]
MKIVLAGSPGISVPAFEEVIKNFEVVGIVTQPDRKKGRGMKITETKVSKLAKKYNIQIFKPEKISLIARELELLNFDLFLTFAFGQYIPQSILKLGKHKPLNIHGSLLPKYRGAAPIHHAILNGEQEIGITLMEMIKEMDAGDIVFKASQTIDEETTTGDAFNIIADLAKQNIVAWMSKIETKDFSFTPQSKEFTLSPKITKEECQLLPGMGINDVKRKIKGFNPYPGAYIIINDIRLKIFSFSSVEIKDSIELVFKDGVIYANDFQWENKKRIIL